MLSCASTMSPRTFRVLAPRARLLIIILAVVCCSQRTSANHHQLSRTIQPNADEETQQKAAMDVIRRLIDDKADDVAIKINFNLPGNYFKVRISASSMHKFSFIMSNRRASPHESSARRTTRGLSASRRPTACRRAKRCNTTWSTSVALMCRGTAISYPN